VESDAQTSSKKLEIWYKPNAPLGIARGIHPGRVAWSHNIKIASWDELFRYYNKTSRNIEAGYASGEKIAIKINQNNTDAHKSNNEINANPQLTLSVLTSLVNEAGVPQENITLADPSRFITDNIYDKCRAAFPNVHYANHNGGDGREKATCVENGFVYSYDFNGMTKGLAACFKEADYIIIK
jgi:hypothetical protein